MKLQHEHNLFGKCFHNISLVFDLKSLAVRKFNVVLIRRARCNSSICMACHLNIKYIETSVQVIRS